MTTNNWKSDLENWKALSKSERLSNAPVLVHSILTEAAREDAIKLYTEFSLWAYFRQKYQLRGVYKRALYQVRTLISSLRRPNSDIANVDDALDILEQWIPFMIHRLIGEEAEIADLKLDTIEDKRDSTILKREDRWLILKKDEKSFWAESENQEDVFRCILDQDLDFLDKPIHEHYGEVIPFPFSIQVFNVEKEGEMLKPENHVLLPDYLVDVTAIAAAFMGKKFEIWSYFVSKLLPRMPTYHLMLGNMVNSMLDRMMLKPEISLSELVPELFQDHTIQISQMDDLAVRKLTNDLKKHFANLRTVVQTGFDQAKIETSSCSLEPSFISNKYGIQGRLDLLFTGKDVSIVELKSGKPFQPNSYGLKLDHYIQTLLYDLLLKSTGISYNSRNFILYSSQSNQTLRYAPPVGNLQKSALEARNLIVLTDFMLIHPQVEVREHLFRLFFRQHFSKISTFLARDADNLKRTLSQLQIEEWKYYIEMLSFAQREMITAKLGDLSSDYRPGHAGLWLDSRDRKEEEFAILQGLRIGEILVKEDESLIRLKFTPATNPLANFRVGDIVVMTPESTSTVGVLTHQLIKGSIISLKSDEVTLRPRSEQVDREYLEGKELWSIERDMMDSSFRMLFENLFTFLSGPREWRKLWLGSHAAAESEDYPIPSGAWEQQLTKRQKTLVKRAFQAKNYFLIWGPPGTGKTKMIIRSLLQLYFTESDKHIYLLSYTNRAVDEMTEVVVNLGEEYPKRTLRFGSRYGTRPEYSSYLYKHQVSALKNRDELNQFLKTKRIWISTLASFWRMRHVIRDRKKSILIVDEASQILEPSLIGLLSYFDKVILIGDHKQLPAVSVQADSDSEVNSKELKSLGFVSTKESLFQRLFRRIRQKDWSHSIGVLNEQGRMHAQIMEWVNQAYYEGQLQELPPRPRNFQWFEQSRILYVPTQAEPYKKMIKNNEEEADVVVRFIEKYLETGNRSINNLSSDEIGVITPFRAQSALIKHHLHKEWGTQAKVITVDTVERYQGGARDVILISACVNHARQLSSIQSLSHEGIDRKLNVAVTRAREGIVLIGNEDALRRSSDYASLIDSASRLSTKL